MFTGLIQKVGKLIGKKTRGDGMVFTIQHDAWDSPLIKGESMAVQGVCLTVTAIRTGEFSCDVLNETVEKTNFAEKVMGVPLNLERALRADERLGGHIVSGHVDGVGTVLAFDPKGADWILEISCDGPLLKGIVPKGSIAIDGISLTIVELRAKSFTVHLIPHTLANTSLRALKRGHSVNLETDVIGKYVQHYLERLQPATGVTMEKLCSAFGGV